MVDYRRHTPACVMITGASGDFGKAFAHRFAALGCRIILHGRSKEKISALQKELDAAKTCAAIFDVTDKAAMKAAIDALPDDFRNIDVLINNAGLALGLDKAYEADADDWDTMIDVDAKALARLTNLILPRMVKAGRGHIINIGSTAGNYAYPGGNVYGAVKAFVKQFSLNLRADLIGTKVRVTNIEPGQVETQFSTVRFKGDKTKADAVYAGTQSLKADDVADCALWVATMPLHVNINRVELMPTCQSFAGLSIERF